MLFGPILYNFGSILRDIIWLKSISEVNNKNNTR